MSQKNRNRSAVPMALAALLLAACGSRQKPVEPPPPVKDTAFGDAVGAMDKARGVEATMLQQKEGLDHALQEQESPAAE